MDSKKHSVPLLISAILGTVISVTALMYLVIILARFIPFVFLGFEGAGYPYVSFIFPQFLFLIVTVPVVLNWFGYAKNNKVCTLIAAIFYTLIFSFPCAILSYVGFAQVKKINEENKSIPETNTENA